MVPIKTPINLNRFPYIQGKQKGLAVSVFKLDRQLNLYMDKAFEPSKTRYTMDTDYYFLEETNIESTKK